MKKVTKLPKDFEEREVKKFAWLPKTFQSREAGVEIEIWLEHYYEVEVYKPYFGERGSWEFKCFRLTSKHEKDKVS